MGRATGRKYIRRLKVVFEDFFLDSSSIIHLLALCCNSFNCQDGFTNAFDCASWGGCVAAAAVQRRQGGGVGFECGDSGEQT